MVKSLVKIAVYYFKGKIYDKQAQLFPSNQRHNADECGKA